MVEPDQHTQLLVQLDAVLRPNPAVRALLVVGSVARATADRWSDLDVIVVVDDDQLALFDPAMHWLSALDAIMASEHHPGSGRGTTRAWLANGRLDLVVATESCFGHTPDWPLWDGVMVCFSRSLLVDRVVAQPQQRPAASLLTDEAFHTLVRVGYAAILLLAIA